MQHLKKEKLSFRLEVDPGIIFPEKLYEVAKDDYLIKWNREGTSISIDESLFEDRVLACYPGFVQISTFANIRRLFREYGFDWDANEDRVFEFSHPNFLRGMPDLLQSIPPRHRSSRFGRGRSGRGRSRIGVKLGPRKHRRNVGISTDLPDSTSFRVSRCEFNDDFNVMNHMTDSEAYESDISSAFEPTSTTMLSKTDVTDIIEAYRRNELLDAEERVPEPVPEWLVYTPVPTVSEEPSQNQPFDPSLCTCCNHCKSRKSLTPDWSVSAADSNPQYYPRPMFAMYSPVHDGSGEGVPTDEGVPAEQDLGNITYL